MKNLQVVVPKPGRKLFFPTPVLPGCLDFVVADPNNYARMIAQTLDVIDGFLTYVVEELLITRVHAASEHKILPDEDSHFVAKFIEVVTLVNASAPDP